jgi:long-chain fatty acid transport protein
MARNLRPALPITALGLALSLATAPRAQASGFQLRDQSGSAQGNAYAGISAGGSDISSMFFNPAAMTRFSGHHLQFGLSFIAPSAKFSDGSASRGAYAPLQVASTPISGATSTGNVAKSAVLPTLYAMYSVDEDLKLGLAVNVPFGLTTEYDSNWIGRYHGIKSHLETLDIAPSIAYKVDSKWSVGFAFVARRAKAELSQGVDFGASAQLALNQLAAQAPQLGLPANVVQGGAADGSVNIKGDSWAYGYRLGVLYEPNPKLRVGMGYQSRIRETLKGDATFSGVSTAAAGLTHVAQLFPNAATGIGIIGAKLGAQAANGPVTAVLKLPSTLSLGASYDVSDTFNLAAEVAQTKWSGFQELRVKFSNSAAQPDSVTREDWKDAMFFALGATCHPQGAWTYRAGLAVDKTPVPDDKRTPRIPDADRTWLSLGASWQVTEAFGLDAGYTHLFCKNSTVNLQAGGNPSAQEFTRGNLQGTYKNSIDVLALQARYKF